MSPRATPSRLLREREHPPLPAGDGCRRARRASLSQPREAGARGVAHTPGPGGRLVDKHPGWAAHRRRAWRLNLQLLSLAPKSDTAAVSMEIARGIGGALLWRPV